VISKHNLFKVYILLSHFDGELRIRRSRIYDFAVNDHEDVMKVVVCWLRATPHGDTALSTYAIVCSQTRRNGRNGLTGKAGEGTREWLINNLRQKLGF
jgi:hypothetical protein